MIEAVFARCDDLDAIPRVNRENYLLELDLLAAQLPVGARVLQVGSMDGRRLLRLEGRRPDLRLTGLEIEPAFVELAQRSADPGTAATFVRGDITNPPELPATTTWCV